MNYDGNSNGRENWERFNLPQDLSERTGFRLANIREDGMPSYSRNPQIIIHLISVEGPIASSEFEVPDKIDSSHYPSKYRVNYVLEENGNKSEESMIVDTTRNNILRSFLEKLISVD